MLVWRMTLDTSTKLCPTCNTENEETATLCVRCGAWLESHPTQVVAIPENIPDPTSPLTDHGVAFIDMAQVPEGGVGIYVAGAFKPFYIHVYRELIIGRVAQDPLQATLDLSDFNAANLGVSRRHAMLRRSDAGFDVMDLASRNGTWLNAERLAANQPYPLKSGSQLRIGQMRLLVMYHPVLKYSRNG